MTRGALDGRPQLRPARDGRTLPVALVSGLAIALVPALLGAQTAERPEVLSRDREMALALSAAPAHLQEGAGVWILERDGYVEARASTNGFTCVVNRDTPKAIKPTCYDAEGTETILPKVVFVGNMLAEGRPLAEINSAVREGFDSGRFISPRRPGIAYMLSSEIRNENPSTGQTSGFPPHIMFYAPNLTNEDIGTTREAMGQNGALPFVGYQGPHGFIIVVQAPACMTPAGCTG